MLDVQNVDVNADVICFRERCKYSPVCPVCLHEESQR